MSETTENNFQSWLRRFWWVLLLILAILGLVCVFIGPGQFLIRPAAPEETPGTIVTEPPPTDEPTTVVPSATPTNTPTSTPTNEPDNPPDDPPDNPPDVPPLLPTEPPTETACVADPNDGVCDLRCENTDLDSNSCVCNLDNVCGVGEGFNCPDCSFGQCGSGCQTDADCHNPSLTCNDGVCGGSTCPAPPPEEVDCSIDKTCSNVTVDYQSNVCKITCSDGSKVIVNCQQIYQTPRCNIGG